MDRKRHTSGRIIGKLRTAEIELAKGPVHRPYVLKISPRVGFFELLARSH
jgi:hypothetical protein